MFGNKLEERTWKAVIGQIHVIQGPNPIRKPIKAMIREPGKSLILKVLMQE